jgi:hypothetical protein
LEKTTTGDAATCAARDDMVATLTRALLCLTMARSGCEVARSIGWSVCKEGKRGKKGRARERRGDKLYKNSHQEGPVYLRLTDFGSAMELSGAERERKE